MNNTTYEFLQNNEKFRCIERWENAKQKFELWQSKWNSNYDKLIVTNK